MTITGHGFTGTSSVLFGGTAAASFTVWNDSTITATVGAGTTGAITVSGPQGSVTAGGFVYLVAAPPPIILLSFTPDSAGPGANITITGHNLSGITAVNFGGTPAQSFRIASDSVIYATVGGGSTGAIEVSASNGSDSLSGFTFLPPPPSIAITGFTPSTGTTGTTVSVSGTNLTAVRSLTFGGTPAQSFVTISDSLILAVVGSGSTGYVSIFNSSSNDSLPGFVYTYDSTRTTDSVPVFNLLNFLGAYSGSDPVLQWQAENDGSIAFYALERETSDNQFEVIATITPTADDSTVHSYNFDDAGHDPGTNHYRLRIQDAAATYSYSKTIAVTMPTKPNMLGLYPNPVIYGFTYVSVPDAGSNSQFQVLDMAGKVMKVQLVNQGIAQISLDLSKLPPGMYKVIWSNGSKFAYQTVLILPEY